MYVSAVVEGSLDDAIVQRLAIHTGLAITAVHGKQGKAALLRDLPGYNKAARFTPWLALVDLDNDYDCVPAALAAWLPKPAPQMAFRVAVQMAEAWLLADRVRLGRFLQLPGGSQAIPKDPEQLADPKRELVNLARKSRTRAIREDLVPREGSGRPVGPAYTSRLSEFASNEANWRPDVAARSSPSLARCLVALRHLREHALPETT